MHGALSTDAKAITQSAQVGWPAVLRPHAGALQRNEKYARNKIYLLFLIKWPTVPQAIHIKRKGLYNLFKVKCITF